MTNDELRALADEMQSNIDEVRIILRGKITVEDKAWFAMHDKAIDYLRACADVQPVAWLRPENRVEEECTARTRISIGERCPPIGTWRPLYTHPAPAAPQVVVSFYTESDELIGTTYAPIKNIRVEDDGSIHVFIDHWPQAEPKREPLSDEQIDEIQRAAYERAEQVCIETAAELRRCADGCTDGRYDWKADGAADCADAISALGRQ